jgi:SAM-dependent methyltransferase
MACILRLQTTQPRHGGGWTIHRLGSDARRGRGRINHVDRTDRLNDPRLSFNAAVAVYDEIRPSYPVGMFDALFALLPPQPRIVEIGPGTGQATKDLLARGAVVHAIEIGPAMAAKLRSNLPSDRLDVSVGDFEHIDIAAQSADAVFSATAYHWISPEARLDRPATILRPGGIVAIVDLVQVSSPEDHGFFAAAQPIYERYGQGHSGPPAPARDDVEPAIRVALTSDPRFGDVAVCRYDWDQTYSATDYRKLMLSYSGTQMMDDGDRVGLLEDIESFINERFDGCVTRPLVVTLTTATLLAGTGADGHASWCESG